MRPACWKQKTDNDPASAAIDKGALILVKDGSADEHRYVEPALGASQRLSHGRTGHALISAVRVAWVRVRSYHSRCDQVRVRSSRSRLAERVTKPRSDPRRTISNGIWLVGVAYCGAPAEIHPSRTAISALFQQGAEPGHVRGIRSPPPPTVDWVPLTLCKR